jgi:hypothetical protein
MRSTLGLVIGSVLARKFKNEDVSSSDYSESNCFNNERPALVRTENKSLNFVTPFVNSALPVNMFSETRASKFTELTYKTIKNLVLPKQNLLNPFSRGCKKISNKMSAEIECEVYSLLLHVINTINPIAFDCFYDAFYSGKYLQCFLILQRLHSSESAFERLITTNVLLLNRKIRREVLNSIYFIDVCTKEVFGIDLPSCRSEKRFPLHLPKQVLKFEDLVHFSFDLDEAIIVDIDYFCPLGLKHIYRELIRNFYKVFNRLSYEQKILQFLRIKFFVFNSVGLTISFLSSGVKQNILEVLIKSARTENEEFFMAYAVALGLLTK